MNKKKNKVIDLLYRKLKENKRIKVALNRHEFEDFINFLMESD